MVLVNAQCLRNKHLEFKTEIIEFNNFPEIVGVTETWFDDSVPADMFTFGVYSEFRRDRGCNPGYGGVALYVRNDVPSELIDVASDLELLWIRVTLKSGPILCCIYYRPSVSLSGEVDLLRDELDKVTSKYVGLPIYLIGDLNLPDVDWANQYASTEYRQDEFLALFSEFNLEQQVFEPTGGTNILDLILTNDEYSVLSTSVEAPLARADHRVVSCILNYEQHEPAMHSETKFCWGMANWPLLQANLAAIDWWDVFDEETCTDIEKMWTKFKDKVF
jgi:hypothetical protein